MAAETPWAETNALLAVIRDDEDEANKILSEMTAVELSELRQACRGLVELTRQHKGVVL